MKKVQFAVLCALFLVLALTQANAYWNEFNRKAEQRMLEADARLDRQLQVHRRAKIIRYSAVALFAAVVIGLLYKIANNKASARPAEDISTTNPRPKNNITVKDVLGKEIKQRLNRFKR